VSSREGSTTRLIGAIKPLVPVEAKRAMKRVVPVRYHGLLDPDWHRRTIGNMQYWDRLGALQLDYLVGHGLKPEHSVLDIGCGPLRAGIHFIRYLDPGRYAGVDKRGDVLAEAWRFELTARDREEKRPKLIALQNFEFARLGRRFDFAIAQSVFTHLDLNRIIRCLMETEHALVPGGSFFATIFENPAGKRNLTDIEQFEGGLTHFDRDVYHYDLGTFEWICAGTSLRVEYLGDWGHPHNQKMLAFRKAADEATATANTATATSAIEAPAAKPA